MDFYRNNESYYDRNVGQYENSSWYFFNKYKDNSVTEEISLCLAEVGKKTVKVLEIGPGTGYLLSKLVRHKLSFDYHGIEHSQEMANLLTTRYSSMIPMKVVKASLSADFLRGYDEGPFDLIIGSSILHHLPDYQKVVPLLAGMLSPGGVMYFVREPIHQTECMPSNRLKDTLAWFYEKINNVLAKPLFKNLFWPKKVKQESAKGVALYMFQEGVAARPFFKLAGFRLLRHRKYNRRISSFLSYLENKWLARLRKDIFGNTLFSIMVKNG